MSFYRDPTYAELEHQVEDLENAMTANDEVMQRLDALNNELVSVLRQLQGMGLGRNAYAICAEAIAKAEAFQP